jgi:hypothetical protein
MAAPPAAPPPRPKAKRLSGAASYLVWGSLAVCAVVATAVVIALGIGASRGGFGVAQTTTVRPAPPIVQKQAVSEFEVARLNDALRALSAERERLAARVEQLERSVGDITASINSVKERAPAPAPANAQPEAKPASASAAPTPVISAESAEQPAARATPPGAIAQSAPPASVQAAAPPVELEPARPAPSHAIRPSQITMVRPPPAPKALKPNPSPPPPAVAAKGPPTQVGQIMPPANLPAADTAASKTEFAIDLGGEMSIDGLRARWANIKGNHGAALEGLRPLVSVREGAKPGTVELRLIAGPVTNAGDAAKVCASLQTKGIACRTTEFDGQKLSLR